MRKPDTIFNRLINYLNEIEDGEVVKRQDMQKAAYGYVPWGQTTVDKWKRQLIVTGYLHESPKPGRYYKIVNIPCTMTTTELESLYNRVNALKWKVGL